MIKAFIVVTVFLYPLIVLATKIKIVTHNQMGIWAHDINDKDVDKYYSDIVKNYFDAVGNADVIIFNFQELMELKPKKAISQLSLTNTSTSTSTNTGNISKRGNLFLKKVHARLVKYFKNDKYNCKSIIEYYMATIVCADKSITKIEVKKYAANFFNGKYQFFGFKYGFLGQKGGMITSITLNGKLILNTNVHLDSKDSKARQTQFKALYNMCEDKREMVKKTNQRSIFIFAGDFNQRSTDAQKKKYKNDMIKKEIKPSKIFENTDEGEMKDTIIRDYDLDEKDITFIPTYKINFEKFSKKKIKFSEIRDSKKISNYYKKNKASYTDRILIDKKLNDFKYTIEKYTILDLDSVFSDHLPVVATITITDFKDNRKEKRKRKYLEINHAESKLII